MPQISQKKKIVLCRPQKNTRFEVQISSIKFYSGSVEEKLCKSFH